MKTEEESVALSFYGEWTNWDYNAVYGYSTGVCYTNSGIINLYHQPSSNEHHPYTKAQIIHNQRLYSLSCEAKVTRLGWVRIAKKWARKIRSG